MRTKLQSLSKKLLSQLNALFGLKQILQKKLFCKLITTVKGGSRIFSRGGGRILKKNIRKVCLLIFRSTKLIF